MKRLVNGMAIIAALVIAAPGWAQNAPSGGNTMGAAGAAPAPAANSAMPPEHHHAVRHARAMHHFHKQMAHKAALTGDTTAQLNREELARIQSGAPPALPPQPTPSPGPMAAPPPH